MKWFAWIIYKRDIQIIPPMFGWETAPSMEPLLPRIWVPRKKFMKFPTKKQCWRMGTWLHLELGTQSIGKSMLYSFYFKMLGSWLICFCFILYFYGLFVTLMFEFLNNFNHQYDKVTCYRYWSCGRFSFVSLVLFASSFKLSEMNQIQDKMSLIGK